MRLDFFRGIALLIIFVNHIPLNAFAAYSPSRFGFSDAADLFVFLSGCTAALVYKKSFERLGAKISSTRIIYRCGQLYIAHLQLFFLLALTCALGNAFMMQTDYISRLNLNYFFDFTKDALPALVTLRYVPNYIDILPLYIAILAFVPMVMLAARVHTWLALGLPLAVYFAASSAGLELPADPQSGRTWFFNPFYWQLAFFTGFAIYARWLPVPKADRRLFILCAVFLFMAIPLSHEPTYRSIAWLSDLRAWVEPFVDKSHYGLVRWLHLLALSYAVAYLLRDKRTLLNQPLPSLINRIGQQSLPMFQIASVLSYLCGMVLDRMGSTAPSLIAVNLGGCLALIAIAGLLLKLKEQPWQQPAPAMASGLAG
jgi:hypothetical protein